jgi:hypothetical protein
MIWLEKTLKEENDRKFIIMDHIYAGARFKHDDTKKANSIWTADNLDKYFKIWDENSDKILIELAGHDHWEDLRIAGGGSLDHPTRNLMVSTGISPDHKQFPGFSTF